MNTQQQIREAIEDFNNGRFGQVTRGPAVRTESRT
jgi:hypothetical protein